MTIILDPGHGRGYNTVRFTSPEELTFSEGTRNFEYALILKRALEKRGFRVGLTRNSVTEDPSHRRRAEIAKELGADLLLSLHSNAKDDDPEKKGVVCLYSMKYKSDRAPALALAGADAAVMGAGIVDVFCSESKSYPGEDYFGILRECARLGVHALIIEHGYHSNFGEAKRLSDDRILTRLAQSEASALFEYYLKEKKTLYRVQAGAFREKNNALGLKNRLRLAGYDAFIEIEDGFFKVFAGSFEIEGNARKCVKRLIDNRYDAFIVERRQTR